MKKVALIIGITGQDGSYLAELLLQKGYIVYGLIRRSSNINTQRIDHIFGKLKLRYGDVTDMGSVMFILQECIKEVQLNDYLEIYNLAAQSHVAISFQLEKYTADVDATGVLNVLQSVRILNLADKVRIYQASTSELYGNTLNMDGVKVLNEESPMNPVSPYAIAKLYAYHMIKYYRKAYNMFCVNGILFNHTSYRRGHNFVCKKICDYVKKYNESKNGLPYVLELGNLNATRDFGHAKDYVRGMWMILNSETPKDYVLASNKRVTIRDFCTKAFDKIHENIEWRGEGLEEVGLIDDKVVVKVSEKYFRPYDLTDLLGDASKVKEELKWEEEYDLDRIINEMIMF